MKWQSSNSGGEIIKALVRRPERIKATALYQALQTAWKVSLTSWGHEAREKGSIRESRSCRTLTRSRRVFKKAS